MTLNIHRKQNVHAFILFVVILNKKSLNNMLVITLSCMSWLMRTPVEHGGF